MTTPLRLIAALVALVVALGAAGCDSVRTYAAKVNGVEISQSRLDEELEAIRANQAYLERLQQGGGSIEGTGSGTFDMAFVSRVLTRQILLELVSQELAERDVEVTDAELQQAREQVVQAVGGEDIFGEFPEGYRRTLIRRQAEVAALQAAVSGEAVDAEAVRRFYEENRQQFQRTCARHILFAPPAAEGGPPNLPPDADASALIAEARQALARIRAGEDFAALAQELSDDRGSGQAGGDLGCEPPGAFVPEFEEAMAELEIGEVSEPVRTQFGIHLIQVTDRRVAPLEEVEGEIRQRLQSRGDEEFSTVLQEAVEEADIVVNPRFGEFRLDESGVPQVVPPEAPTTTAPLGDGGSGTGPAGQP